MADPEGKFVSRAGAKLDHALAEFGIDVAGKVCADLGCSTGGFTDCLLQRGAAKVYAVDTGYGVIDWKLRNDPRVALMERTNALHVELPEKPDFVSVDVSWTPQRRVIPHAFELLKERGDVVTLVKPHYEADKKLLRNGTLPDEYVAPTVEAVKAELESLGFMVKGETVSPITGEKGKNTEYLLWLKKA